MLHVHTSVWDGGEGRLLPLLNQAFRFTLRAVALIAEINGKRGMLKERRRGMQQPKSKES